MDIKYVVVVEYINNLILRLKQCNEDKSLAYMQILTRIHNRLSDIVTSVNPASKEFVEILPQGFYMDAENQIFADLPYVLKNKDMQDTEKQRRYPTAYGRVHWLDTVCTEVENVQKGIAAYRVVNALSSFESLLLLYLLCLDFQERKVFCHLEGVDALRMLHKIYRPIVERTYLGSDDEYMAFKTFYKAIGSVLMDGVKYSDIDVYNIYECFCYLYDNDYIMKG